MATLTGSTIAATYDQLLALPSGGLNGATLVALTDGNASATCALSVATTSIAISATDKLYLDDGGNTYITESAADIMDFYAGNVHMLSLDETNDEVVINEGSADIDFRVESNGKASMLFVDGGNNRVGIGTASPDAQFHLYESATAELVQVIQASNGNVQLKLQGTSAEVLFNDVTGSAYDGKIGVNSDLMTFYGGNDSGSPASAYMTIELNGGQVGIGTAAPAYELHIEDASSSCYVKIEASADAEAGIIFDNQDQKWTIGVDGPSSGTDDVFVISSATGFGTERLSITPAGNVGIGTTVPNKDLSVHSSDGGVLALNREDADNAITNGNALGKIIFGGDAPTDNTFQEGAAIYALADGTWADSDCGANIAFYTCADGANTLVEHMRIMDNGRIGIGTTSPINTLHVAHNIADGDNGIMIVNEQTTITNGELLGAIGFDGADGNIPSSCLEASCFIAAYAAEAHGAGDKGGDLVFGCSLINENDDVVSTEHMRILDSGYIGIGTDAPSSLLELEGSDGGHVNLSLYCTDGGNNDCIVRFGGADDNTASVDADFDWCIGLDRSANTFEMCYASGGVTTASAGAFFTATTAGVMSGDFDDTSDRNLKKNIVDTSYGLSTVNQLRAVDFEWKNELKGKGVGFIAQEVELLVPEIVHGDDYEVIKQVVNGVEEDSSNSGKSINVTGIVSMLVKAVQELSAKVTALENA